MVFLLLYISIMTLEIQGSQDAERRMFEEGGPHWNFLTPLWDSVSHWWTGGNKGHLSDWMGWPTWSYGFGRHWTVHRGSHRALWSKWWAYRHGNVLLGGGNSTLYPLGGKHVGQETPSSSDVTTRNISPVWTDAGNDLQKLYSYKMMWLSHGPIRKNVISLCLATVLWDAEPSNFY